LGLLTLCRTMLLRRFFITWYLMTFLLFH